WNFPYTLTGTMTNFTWAHLRCSVTIAASDHASVPATPVELMSRLPRSLPLSVPILQRWEWFDQPTFHIRDADLSRSFTYTPTATEITDEFGNPYPDVPGRPTTVIVRVDSSKIDAAKEVEQDFWANGGLTAGQIILGVISIFAPPVVVVAGGLAGAMVLVTADSSQWTTVANDPPTPDPDYWTFLKPPDLI